MSEANSLDALLTELEERARKATPGPWNVYRCDYAEPGAACGIDPMGAFDCSYDECHHPLNTSDARHIASASPDTILKLVAVIRRMREGLELSRFALTNHVAPEETKETLEKIEEALSALKGNQ